MIRMLGVLCGAAIAIALLTWLVGVPQFTSERTVVDSPHAVVALRDSVPAADTGPESPAAESAIATESGPEPLVEAPPSPEAPLAEAETSLAEERPVPPADTLELTPVVEAAVLPDLQWFAFWTPFRSEIAANGFVGRLQSVTGLDYRVVKVKPGVYEVAFAYVEDAEIDSNLSTISAATGLDLPGGQ